MIHDAEPVAVACSLSQGDLARRAARWRTLADAALEQVSTTEQGQRLAFHDSPGIAGELEELSALERGCCSFATWSVTKVDDRLVLDISSATEEGAQAVQAVFLDLPRSAARHGQSGPMTNQPASRYR